MAVIYKVVCQLLSQTLAESGEVTANHNCCLCYQPVPVELDTVKLGDEVVYSTVYGEHSEEMSHILTDLLGDDVAEVAKLFKSICSSCTKNVITCHKFITLCKKNVEQFNFAFKNLFDCFHNTAGNLYDFQSMYVAVNQMETKQFYDVKRKPKEFALARFKYLQSANKHQTDSVKIEIEIGEEKKEQIEKKKLQKDLSTIFIKTHELVADPGKPNEYKCKMCFKSFPIPGTLRNHFFSTHFKKEFQCKQCNKSFGTAGLLNTHVKQIHNKVECKTCHKLLVNHSTKIKRHQLTHLSKLVQVCNRCGRTYQRSADFKKHMAKQTCKKTSQGPRQLVCDYCGKICHFKHQIKSHILREHLLVVTMDRPLIKKECKE